MPRALPTLVLGLLGLAGCATAPVAGGADAAPEPVDLETLWAEALTFGDFLEGVRARREAWHANYQNAALDDELVERLGVLPRRYRILAVSIDGCTDSVANLPYIARLAERVPGLELRIIGADRARALMERHPTPDGRAATPTVVLLDELYREAGCWIERPAPLQSWYLEQRTTRAPIEEVYSGIVSWYEEDAGRTTLREIGALVEAATNGARVCP